MKTVFMFSGQGAQYAGMGKNLYKNYPVAKEILTGQIMYLVIPLRIFVLKMNRN